MKSGGRENAANVRLWVETPIAGSIRRCLLGRIDIQRSQIMAAARCTKPVKWTVRRS
ncbi:conserved hypothetical protein [Sphingomonas sp. 8AM]|nr:conserved hypothetical protein [Sphingomonas sp. 8AM]